MKDQLPHRAGRRLLHTRQITCTGYLRDDGLIELEGRLLDTKPSDLVDVYRIVRAGEPLHQMRVVMVVDKEFVIRKISALTEAAPTPECPGIASAYAALEGLRIGPGFTRQVKARMGGAQGCTHLTELLGPMATTLYQSGMPLQVEAMRQRAIAEPGYEPPKPFVIGACHAYRVDGEPAWRLQEQWGDWRRQVIAGAPEAE
ncbi:DUF2889 domain-containing protein [Pseudomonas aeruginosa]|uniref:DUF2889 domain-containing protein n=1 Tax=Pseudomonas aeruginosa TaxID=287 RepID=UPI001F0BE328|nr:DUF2889 domain-containing protein [Pseudomonas aeruginosa]MCP9254287.1 DUF2889 domain-containing protein [Pseudomonas aeruginosa]HCF6450017.1 DUF2889 domain-containing protein [Pseudomonas aeruginosa]